MTCRNCWDPAPRGQELCSWCRLTPLEQRRKVNQAYGALLAVVLVILGAIACASYYAAQSVATPAVRSK
jgi:predicted nucleic acid-binding Zn ribbon protein